MSGFRRGSPRPGQWVWVDRSRVGVATEPDDGSFVVVGDVVTKRDKKRPVSFSGRWIVELLDKSGLAADYHVSVPLNRLEPVVNREHIPAGRLETMDPSWEPCP